MKLTTLNQIQVPIWTIQLRTRIGLQSSIGLSVIETGTEFSIAKSGFIDWLNLKGTRREFNRNSRSRLTTIYSCPYFWLVLSRAVLKYILEKVRVQAQALVWSLKLIRPYTDSRALKNCTPFVSTSVLSLALVALVVCNNWEEECDNLAIRRTLIALKPRIFSPKSFCYTLSGWLNWETYVADANFASVKQENVFKSSQEHLCFPDPNSAPAS